MIRSEKIEKAFEECKLENEVFSFLIDVVYGFAYEPVNNSNEFYLGIEYHDLQSYLLSPDDKTFFVIVEEFTLIFPKQTEDQVISKFTKLYNLRAFL